MAGARVSIRSPQPQHPDHLDGQGDGRRSKASRVTRATAPERAHEARGEHDPLEGHGELRGCRRAPPLPCRPLPRRLAPSMTPPSSPRLDGQGEVKPPRVSLRASPGSTATFTARADSTVLPELATATSKASTSLRPAPRCMTATASEVGLDAAGQGSLVAVEGQGHRPAPRRVWWATATTTATATDRALAAGAGYATRLRGRLRGFVSSMNALSKGEPTWPASAGSPPPSSRMRQNSS